MIRSSVEKNEHISLHKQHKSERLDRDAMGKNKINIGEINVEPQVDESELDENDMNHACGTAKYHRSLR